MLYVIKKHVVYIIIFLTIAYPNRPLFSQQGFLKIDSPEFGLIVTLNDSLAGTTPLELLKIDCGPYELKISNPKKGLWKNNDWLQQINIVANDTTTVKAVFNRTIIIRSTPYDAKILLDNKHIGNTPLYFELPSSNNRLLLIKKKYFEPYRIDLFKNPVSTINVSLKPIGNLPNHFHNIQFQKEKKLQRNKKLAYALMAVAICSGLATVYFKDKAELKYNQYLTAGNVKDMNRYYADTKKFDKIYSISLGVFEVSFVLSFYFLIKGER